MYKYVGPGYLPGYPAKDLTPETIKRLNLDVRVLNKSKLYKKVKPVEKAESNEGNE